MLREADGPRSVRLLVLATDNPVMHEHRRLPRLATAVATSVLVGLPFLLGAPAAATDDVVIDVLKFVDGEYVVQTVAVPPPNAEATADRLEAAPDVVAADPAVTYQVQGAPDPHWESDDPGGASNVRTAWTRTRGAGQTVAVLDTASDLDHPDLAGALVPGKDLVGGPGNPWHGTGVAGLVAARADNGIGSAGMAPEAKVMPVRVCNDAGCPSSVIARGILWAADHGADVINLSLAGTGFSEVTAAAIRYALDRNIPVVAATGNDGLEGNPVMYPAAHSGVIAVSATTPSGAAADWAVHGWQADIATVGEGVLLTGPGGGYAYGDGTSFSAPAVAGAVALLRASAPGVAVEDLQAALQASADSSGWNRAWGAGRLDVPAALDAVDRTGAAVTVTAGAQSASLGWSAVEGATSYTVRVDGAVRAEVTGTSATVTGLVNGNQVAVDVQPSGGARTRPVLATIAAGALGTPVLHSASVSGTSPGLVLTFSASATGAGVSKYALLRNGVSIGTYATALTGTPKTLTATVGATPAYAVRWQLQGIGDHGRSSAYSNALTTGSTLPAPPATVTGLSGHAADGEVLLTWDDLGSPYSYRVSVGGEVVATPRTAGTTLPAPAVGESREYSVAAVDGWGQSGPAVGTTVVPDGRPRMDAAPAVVGRLVVGETVWTRDAFSGADAVTHAWRACDAESCSAVPGDVTHVITEAEVGRRLEVEAVATNAHGVTSAIGPLSARVVPVRPTVPGAPEIAQVTARDSAAMVRWTPPADDGGSPVTGYSVTAHRDGDAVIGTSTGTGAATSVVVPHLVNGASYTFTVVATNALGHGPTSQHSAAVTPVPATAPGAPVVGTPVPGNGTLRLAWSAPADDGGAPVQAYRVRLYRGVVELSSWTTVVPNGSVAGLANGAEHTISVTATNAAGTGPAASVRATPRTVPGPARIGTPSSAPGAAVVRWAPPTSNGGSPLLSYGIRVYRGAALVKVVYAPGAATSTTVPGLLNGSAHTFVVAANNAAGAGPASARSAAVVPRNRPSPPRIAWVNPGRSSATVRWSPPHNGGSPLTAYVVRAYRGSTMVRSVSVGAGTTLYALGGLTPGTAHTFTVTAVNAVGWGPASSPSRPIAPLR